MNCNQPWRLLRMGIVHARWHVIRNRLAWSWSGWHVTLIHIVLECCMHTHVDTNRMLKMVFDDIPTSNLLTITPRSPLSRFAKINESSTLTTPTELQSQCLPSLVVYYIHPDHRGIITCLARPKSVMWKLLGNTVSRHNDRASTTVQASSRPFFGFHTTRLELPGRLTVTLYCMRWSNAMRFLNCKKGWIVG